MGVGAQGDAEGAGETKVGELEVVIFVNEEILRFEVSNSIRRCQKQRGKPLESEEATEKILIDQQNGLTDAICVGYGNS